MTVMAMLGHVEVDWTAGRWSAARPALVMLPAAGGHALLTGGRTRTLLAAVVRETSADASSDLFVVRRAQRGAPDVVFVACRDEQDVRALAERLGITFESSVAERLSAMLPSLDSYLAVCRSTPAARGFGFERLDAATLTWHSAECDDASGLYRYQRYGRHEFRFVDGRSEVYATDLSLGVYAELRRTSQQVLRYQPEATNGVLVVPGGAPLPALHGRAAALCSGLAPRWSRTESGHRFLNLPTHVAIRIARALGQELRQTAAG
jgi:hypothetical protein